MAESWKFGEWLAQALRERGTSQARLARDLGVSQSAVSRWIAGKTGIDNASLQAVARYFGVAPGVLLPLTGMRIGNEDSVIASAQRTRLSAEEEADLARFRAKWDYLHAKYPRPFWSIIDEWLDAWDATTERSLELLRSHDGALARNGTDGNASRVPHKNGQGAKPEEQDARDDRQDGEQPPAARDADADQRQ